MAVSKSLPHAAAGQVPTPETLPQVFWRRYRRNFMALVGLVLVIAFVLIAVFAPLLAKPEAYAALTLEVALRQEYSYIPFRRLIDLGIRYGGSYYPDVSPLRDKGAG